MTIRPPSEATQLAFLTSVQRILDEGKFTATYKFALLLVLVEIAVESGDDSGGEAEIEIAAIAEKFMELYWDHTRPYAGHVLWQNRGANIAVLGALSALQQRTHSIVEARRSPAWAGARQRVGRIVREMPLFKLQTLRGEEKLPFLYDEELSGDRIRLKPGVTYCLRRFSGLLSSLLRHEWLHEIRRMPQNAGAVGETESLEAFLFGQERVALDRVRDVLWAHQAGQCFYCERRIARAPHVDHFIPWARYPSNLAHNFVLADGACNGDKSDLLADVAYLARWWQRNEQFGQQLADGFDQRDMLTDLPATKGIAVWAYSRAQAAGSLLWAGRGQARPFPADATMPFEVSG